MCGIVCYAGKRQAEPLLIESLKRLEYRGYDSSGVAVALSGKPLISVCKAPGKIKELERALKQKPLRGVTGIAHTRWATHGAPTQANAHPHPDCSGKIAVVHNGIIENYESLRVSLTRDGHKFRSQTDTEVLAHLIEKFYNGCSLEAAVRRALKDVVGSFAIGVIATREPGKIVGARSGSPLIVGIGKDENFLASDVSAVLGFTKEVIFLEENEVVVIDRETVRVSDLAGKAVARQATKINWDLAQAQKGGYKHFMLKEINEQPEIIENVLKLRVRKPDNKIIFEELKVSDAALKRAKTIAIVACGTAYHAGLVGKYIIESLCRIPVAVDVSSEFRYRSPLIGPDTLVVPISQSGETADTLAGLREAKAHGAPVAAVCNVLGSTIAREADGVIYTHAGPEIGVASTKAYTAQVMTMYLFALHLAQVRGILSAASVNDYVGQLGAIPAQMQEILRCQREIGKLARTHAHFGSFLYLGRNVNYPSALEGALKLKEISYIPAEGYAAGEMKHGPIALIDEYRAVVCICPHSVIYEKMVSNIQEIRSRKGKIIVIASEGDTMIGDLAKEVIYIPKTAEIFSPLLAVVPMQLLAYHIAVKRGCDVDQPRNLAKSVTVE